MQAYVDLLEVYVHQAVCTNEELVDMNLALHANLKTSLDTVSELRALAIQLAALISSTLCPSKPIK